MAPRLEEDKVIEIENACRLLPLKGSAKKLAELATQYSTTCRTIRRIRKRVISQKERGRIGRAMKLTSKHDEAVTCFMGKNPFCFQDEVLEMYKAVFCTVVERSAVSRQLARLEKDWEEKMAQARARNQADRRTWEWDSLQYLAPQLVFVEELGAEHRERGNMVVGVDEEVRTWVEGRQRVGILAGVSVEGYIAELIYPEHITESVFECFVVNSVIAVMGRYPERNSVLVLPHSTTTPSFHPFLANIRMVARNRGVVLRFLPPASGDFSPMNASLEDLKHFVRQMYKSRIGDFANYANFMEWAVKERMKGDKAAKKSRANFEKAGVLGLPED